MDVHRDEVGHLKKLITQKDEELQKTVQKYEQVIQVLSDYQRSGPRVCFFFFFLNGVPLFS